jgi:hypothetical protein
VTEQERRPAALAGERNRDRSAVVPTNEHNLPFDLNQPFFTASSTSSRPSRASEKSIAVFSSS